MDAILLLFRVAVRMVGAMIVMGGIVSSSDGYIQGPNWVTAGLLCLILAEVNRIDRPVVPFFTEGQSER
jgi:uncharacterized membrane protein